MKNAFYYRICSNFVSGESQFSIQGHQAGKYKLLFIILAISFTSTRIGSSQSSKSTSNVTVLSHFLVQNCAVTLTCGGAQCIMIPTGSQCHKHLALLQDVGTHSNFWTLQTLHCIYLTSFPFPTFIPYPYLLLGHIHQSSTSTPSQQSQEQGCTLVPLFHLIPSISLSVTLTPNVFLFTQLITITLCLTWDPMTMLLHTSH